MKSKREFTREQAQRPVTTTLDTTSYAQGRPEVIVQPFELTENTQNTLSGMLETCIATRLVSALLEAREALTIDWNETQRVFTVRFKGRLGPDCEAPLSPFSRGDRPAVEL